MLTTICDGVWATVQEHYMSGRIYFPARMTALRLGDGSLLLYSPVTIDDALAEELAGHGPVAHIVAPSLLHHTWFQDACERYPEARFYGVPGLRERRPDLTIHEELWEQTPDALRDDVTLVPIRGVPKVGELALVHKSSRSAVVADLVFNMSEYQNFQTRLLFRVVGAYKKLAQSRTWRFATKDRTAHRESLQALLACEPERLIPGHGDIVEGDVAERLHEAARWTLTEV